jgi:hypothetical protein
MMADPVSTAASRNPDAPATDHPLREVISTGAQWQDVTTNSLPSITYNEDLFVSFVQFAVEYLSHVYDVIAYIIFILCPLSIK